MKADVRFGSKADVAPGNLKVRFTPNNGRQNWTRVTSGSLAMFAAIRRAADGKVAYRT